MNVRGFRGAVPLFIASTVSAAALGLTGSPAGSESDAAVFQLLTMARDGGHYHAVEAGTAFFIDPGGTALTNSHVVSYASRDPGGFQLLALVGREFYGATIVCASKLAYDPADTAAAAFGRDVAEVKVVPSRFLFTRLQWPNSEDWYSAHLTRLPSFPVLALGRDPAPGDPVRVVGFGRITERLIDNPGERWAATGTVSATGTASDGTPVFRVASVNRPRPGNSGSPVLGSQGRVVGMWTWNEMSNFAFGVAIGSSALTAPCR
jgi:S1-C subfamily serine protease